MFEHLDDPEGLGPTGDLRAEVVRVGRRRRRARRLAWTGTAVVAVVGATAIAAYAYVDRKVDRIDRVTVASLAPEPTRSEPYVVLFRGLDDASGLPPGDPVRAGREEVVGERADTLVLIRIDPATEQITTMALPRDLAVARPDGTTVRMAQLDLDDTVTAIRDELGIDVHRVVETDLAGVVAIGDALGGIRLALFGDLRDPTSGLSIDEGTRPCQVLDGAQVLALARSRRLARVASHGPGGERTEPVDTRGDLDRMERQHTILVAGLQAFSRLDLRSPAAVDRFLDTVADHVTLDAGASKADLLDLFRDLTDSHLVQFRDLLTSDLRPSKLPTRDEQVEGADVLVLGDGAAEAAERFRTGTVPKPGSGSDEMPPPGDVALALTEC